MHLCRVQRMPFHRSCLLMLMTSALQVMVWDPDVNKAIAKVLDIEKEIQELIQIT